MPASVRRSVWRIEAESCGLDGGRGSVCASWIYRVQLPVRALDARVVVSIDREDARVHV